MTHNTDSASRIHGGVLLEPKAEPVPERKRRKKKLPKVISAVEAEMLLDSIESEKGTIGLRNRLMVELLYRAGLRVSEVVKLAPRDVDMDGVIRLYDAKGGDGTAYFPADELADQFEAWKTVRQEWLDKTEARWTGLYPLFVKPSGDPVGVRYLQRLVKRHKEQLGIVGIVTPHVFRHTFATQLLEEGFQLTEVQASLRHQHLATTAVYLHVRDEALRRKMTRRSRPTIQREEV